MRFNAHDVEKNAEISHIFLTEDEVESQVTELNKIVETMDILEQVDTSSVEPLTHVFPNSNVVRADEIGETLSEEKTFSNAPEVEERMFKVPKIV